MNEKYEEVWKDVAGYEGKYQVSNMGRFKSLNYNNTGMEMVLNLKPNRFTGYVSCSPIGYIHRLVLMTFNPIDNMEEYQCDHINSIRDDNRLENLRWVSRSENNSTKHSKYKRGLNYRYNSHKHQFIKCVFQDGHIEYFRNIPDASNGIGCSTTLVVQALKTDREWKAKGCKLEYISKDADECKNYNERIKRQAWIKKQNNLIEKIEERIRVWNNHTSVIPTYAKERNLKKLREMLIQEQKKLRIFLESE